MSSRYNNRLQHLIRLVDELSFAVNPATYRKSLTREEWNLLDELNMKHNRPMDSDRDYGIIDQSQGEKIALAMERCLDGFNMVLAHEKLSGWEVGRLEEYRSGIEKISLMPMNELIGNQTMIAHYLDFKVSMELNDLIRFDEDDRRQE